MTFQVLVLVLDAASALLANSAGKAASNRANTARNTESLFGRTECQGMVTPSQVGKRFSILRAPVHGNQSPMARCAAPCLGALGSTRSDQRPGPARTTTATPASPLQGPHWLSPGIEPDRPRLVDPASYRVSSATDACLD